MWKRHFILIYLSLLLSHNIVWSFNVETEHYAIYRGRVESMFGYSVAEYRETDQRGWVIVGAPKNPANLKGVGGAVFRCDIAEDGRCFPIEFDRVGTHYFENSKDHSGIKHAVAIDNKTEQWLGATISTSMEPGGPILACAPKYNWFGYKSQGTQATSAAGLRDVIGTCFVTDLSGKYPTEFSPCRNNETAGHHRQGMCEAGVGAAITKDGKRVFIGAPGSFYWQGQLFAVPSNEQIPFVPDKPNSKHYRPINYLSTREGPPHEDNNFLGYSVAVGDFQGNGDSGVAVGVPRALDLAGKVLLFTSNLHNHYNISGEQMGAYFGYALAVNDIDGDNKDDLIVTAPFYTQPEFAGIKIETGRIYVFYQKDGFQAENHHVIDGDNNRGQFGLSVASLGDIDLDGYGDFVVGEPYGGPEQRGAVYIFHGTSEGVEEKYSQVIYSENLEQPVRTFGWSVSGGTDLDKNHYPDLVVGAYESNTVAFFRARPVINMNSEINFDSQSINLKQKSCVLSDGTAVACAGVKFCCMYTGQGSWPQHQFNIHLVLDDKKKTNPRLFLLDFENKNVLNWTVPVKKDQLYCRTLKVYVSQHLRDKLTSLDAEVQIDLADDSHSNNWTKRDPKRRLNAILGPKNVKKRDALTIQKNCGTDNVCVPDLALNIQKNVDKYLLGSQTLLNISVKISNYGEDAFESVFYLQLPHGIDYVNVDTKGEKNDVIIQCTAPKPSNNNTLRCDVGNPLPGDKVVNFKIFLQPITFHGMKPSYELSMKVNSTNAEKPGTLRNNIQDLSIPVWIETDIYVEGESKPQIIDFNSVDYANIDQTQLYKLEHGPNITHNYTIRNNGPSSVLNISASLIWTAALRDGEVLLYLLEQPESSDEDKVYCQPANYDHLSIAGRRRPRNVDDFSRLESLTKVLFTNPVVQEESKRSVRKATNYLPQNDEDIMLERESLCRGVQCVYLECYVGPLKKGEEVSISARYRINMTALKEFSGNDTMKISTKLNTIVEEQPYIGKPLKELKKNFIIETEIVPAKIIPVAETIPLWMIILAICAGILLLLLLICCLNKCGFFKRNRPSVSAEREPLNRS